MPVCGIFLGSQLFTSREGSSSLQTADGRQITRQGGTCVYASDAGPSRTGGVRGSHPRAAGLRRARRRAVAYRRSGVRDRKSTRLNSSHSQISYAVFCLKKKIITLDIVQSYLDYTPHKRGMTTPLKQSDSATHYPADSYSSYTYLLP